MKARIVAQDYRLQKDMSMFAATPSTMALRLLFAISVMLGWEVSAADVESAFLNAQATEQIAIIPPPEETQNQDEVWLCQKALYGFRCSPKAFGQHLCRVLQSQRWIQTKSEPCFYVLFGSHSVPIAVLLHHVQLS